LNSETKVIIIKKIIFIALFFYLFASATCFDPNLFQNKVVIVTGGASGIGKAIVKAFLQHQAQVVCADMNKQNGLALIKNARCFNQKFNMDLFK